MKKNDDFLAIGMCLGMVWGTLFDNLVLGISIGLVLGSTIVLCSNKKSELSKRINKGDENI